VKKWQIISAILIGLAINNYVLRPHFQTPKPQTPIAQSIVEQPARYMASEIKPIFDNWAKDSVARSIENRRKKGYAVTEYNKNLVTKIPGRPLEECIKPGKVIDQEVMDCYQDHYEANR
jgi:hypothetical protein